VTSFLQFVEVRGKIKQKGSYENRGDTIREAEGKGKGEEGEGIGRVIEGINVLKVYHKHIWKCYDETASYIQFHVD
jgi:hypothetical protein